MIKLKIGMLGLGMICEPQSLSEMVETRYEAYLDNGNPQYLLNIKWEEPDSALINPGGTIDHVEGRYYQSVYVISDPNYAATIDPTASSAQLRFRSARPVEDVDYFFRLVISHGFLQTGGFLFHSAGIVRNENAYLLFGKSGSGKTTAARHARGGAILSDDLVGVSPTREGIMAYSTPFWNPGWERQTNMKAGVAGFYRLVKSHEIALEPMRGSIAVSEILSSIPVVPQNEKYCTQLISTIQNMVAQVGAYYLHLRRDDAYWSVLTPGESA